MNIRKTIINLIQELVLNPSQIVNAVEALEEKDLEISTFVNGFNILKRGVTFMRVQYLETKVHIIFAFDHWYFSDFPQINDDSQETARELFDKVMAAPDKREPTSCTLAC